MADSLKTFFNGEVVAAIGRDLAGAHPRLDLERFVAECLAGLDDLELTGRGRHIAEVMRRHLPEDFERAAEVIVRSLRNPHSVPDWRGMAAFRYLPHTCFVAQYGAEHFEAAMRAQYELTQRFTAEFSIRVFLERHPRETLERLREWAGDANHHVRRLVSEGTRPRLPWAARLRAFQRDPGLVLELLELLKDDPEPYVRRSVANNLNDIAKDHPERVVEVCRRWWRGGSADRRWVVRHALRSLVKQGHPGALELLGVGAAPRVRVSPARLPRTARVGEKVRFTFDVASTARAAQTLQVDYRVHFVKANGAALPKVFKLRRLELGAGETQTLAAAVSFAPMTTRKPYAGEHRFEALINGVAFPLGALRLKQRCG